MDNKQYEEKVVKVLDALAKDDLANEDGEYVQTLHLLLQEISTKKIFETILFESDVRKIIKKNEPLTSKQIIDLSIALRQREEPLKLVVPVNAFEINTEDIIESRKLDPQKNNNNKRKFYNKRKKYQNNNQKQNVVTH